MSAAVHRRAWRITLLVGALAAAILTVVVANAGVSKELVYETNVTGRNSVLRLDANGYPVIAFWDFDQSSLKLAHCSDLTCSGPVSIQTVSNLSGDDGRHLDMELDASGYPVISFSVVAQDQKLFLAHCNDANCDPAVNGPESIVELASGGNFGQNGPGWFNQVELVGGKPVIAHIHSGYQDLILITCDDANCTTFSDHVVDPNAGSAPSTDIDLSLMIGGDGFPVMAYKPAGIALPLRVAHCGTADCSASVNREDIGTDYGFNTSMTRNSSGFPVIAYGDGSGLNLLVCNDYLCDGDTPIDVNANSVSWGTSIQLDGSGNPVIAYGDFDLRLLRCGNATCTSGNVDIVLDAGTAMEPSLRLDGSGFVAVSFYDADGADLAFIRCTDVACTEEVVDTTPPVIQFIPEKLLPDGKWLPYSGEWHNGLVRVRVVCTDDHPDSSGIAFDYTPARFWFELDGVFTVPTGAVPGSRCRDGAGNEAASGPAAPITVRVDRRAPKCTVTPSPASFSRNKAWQTVNVTLSPGAGPSGKAAAWLVSVTGGAAADRSGWATGTEDYSGQLRGGARRTYTLTYAVRDQAGNVGTCSATVKVS